MNKKKYVTPECKVYHLQTQKMLTGSYSGAKLTGTVDTEAQTGGGSTIGDPVQNTNEGIKWFGGY